MASGFGGVERVAHELATAWGGTVYSLDAQGQSLAGHDPLMWVIPSSCSVLSRLDACCCCLLWFVATFAFLDPLHGHLPSPGVLVVAVLARLMHPRRRVSAHWHCFLEAGGGFSGLLFGVYQWLALRLLPHFSAVVTTSPLLAQELLRCGCSRRRVFVLPCCLSLQQEQLALALPALKL